MIQKGCILGVAILRPTVSNELLEDSQVLSNQAIGGQKQPNPGCCLELEELRFIYKEKMQTACCC